MPRRTPRPFRPSVVRHYAPGGSRCKSTDPGAVARKERLDTFYAKLGGKKVSLGTTDEGQAWERLRALLRRRAEGRAGLRDGYTDHAERPLAEHLADYLAVLRAKGDGEPHVAKVRLDVERVAREAGWRSVADVTAESCLLAVGRIAARLNHGPRTRNDLVGHCKQFARWLSRPTVGRLRGNPLDSPDLAPLPTDTDRRHDRRAPADTEIAALMAYLHGPSAKRRRGMDGPTRALGYRVCMATGLRAAELGSLRPGNFDLAAGTVTVTGAYSKNRRRDTQQLPPWLVSELREFFAAGYTGWNFPRLSPGRILYADLLAAGVPISVPSPSGPLFFDFHSLRHWFISFVANQPGVSPKTLQALARHSSAALSLKVYAHVRTADVRRVVDSMPPPGQPAVPLPKVPPPVTPAAEATGRKLTKADEMSTPERAAEGRGRGGQKPRGGDAKC